MHLKSSKIFSFTNEREVGFHRPIKLFDAAKRNKDFVRRLKLERRLDVHHGCVNTICWNESGNTILSGSDDQHLVIANPFTGKVAASIPSGHHSNIFSAKFLPNTQDGEIISCSGAGNIFYTEVEREDLYGKRCFDCHVGTTYEVVVVPSEVATFLSCGEDGTVRWFDLRLKTSCNTERCKEDILINCHHAVTSLAVDPILPYQLAAACADGSVRVFDRRMLGTRSSGAYSRRAVTGMLCRFLAPLEHKTFRITSLSYSPCGHDILVSYSAENIYLFNTQMQKDKCFCKSGAKEEVVDEEQLPWHSSLLSSSNVPSKRLRLRGDWSDTGPQARPERERTDQQHFNLMQRMSDMLTRWLEGSLQQGEENHSERTEQLSQDAVSAEQHSPFQVERHASSFREPASEDIQDSGQGECSSRSNFEESVTGKLLTPEDGSKCGIKTEVSVSTSIIATDEETNASMKYLITKTPASAVPNSSEMLAGYKESINSDGKEILDDMERIYSRSDLQSCSAYRIKKDSLGSCSSLDLKLYAETEHSHQSHCNNLTSVPGSLHRKEDNFSKQNDLQISSLHNPSSIFTLIPGIISDNSNEMVSDSLEASGKTGSECFRSLVPTLVTLAHEACLKMVNSAYYDNKRSVISTICTAYTEGDKADPPHPSVSSHTAVLLSNSSNVLTVFPSMQYKSCSIFPALFPDEENQIPLSSSTDINSLQRKLLLPTTGVNNGKDKDGGEFVKSIMQEGLYVGSVSKSNTETQLCGESSVTTSSIEDMQKFADDCHGIAAAGEDLAETKEDLLSVARKQSLQKILNPEIIQNSTSAIKSNMQTVQIKHEKDCSVSISQLSINLPTGKTDIETAKGLQTVEDVSASLQVHEKQEDKQDLELENSSENQQETSLSCSRKVRPIEALSTYSSSGIRHHHHGSPSVGSMHSTFEQQEEDVSNDGDENLHAVPSSHQYNAQHSRIIERAVLRMQTKYKKQLEERDEKDMQSIFHPQVVHKYEGHRNGRTMIKEATFWGDMIVMSGSDCGHIFIWDRDSTQLIMLLEADRHVVNCLQPHPFDPILASSGIDYDVKIWMPQEEQPRFDRDLAEEVMRRNQIMLEETRDTITVPAAFMLRVLASLNQIRAGRADAGQQRDSPGNSD